MNKACWHRFQILIKRAERLANLAPSLSWTDNMRSVCSNRFIGSKMKKVGIVYGTSLCYSIGGRLVIVCFTERTAGIIRIISARPTTKKESKNYEENIKI